MLSLSKTKMCKEYVFIKKHPLQMYAIEDVALQFKNSKDKASDIAYFYLSKVNFEKLKFVIKLMANSDGKRPLNLNQVREYTEQLVMDAVKNYIANGTDAVYMSESIVVSISSYNGKHNLSISPRLDFLK